MENRVALIGILVEERDSAEQVNQILHEYADCILGRMGIPYRMREVGIISVALDAPADTISALSGKLGQLSGVTAKTIYAKIAARA